MLVHRLIQLVSLACLLVVNRNRDLGFFVFVLLVILNIVTWHLPCTTSTQRSTRSRRSCRFRMLPIMKTSHMIFRTSHMWDCPQGAREACILSSTRRQRNGLFTNEWAQCVVPSSKSSYMWDCPEGQGKFAFFPLQRDKRMDSSQNEWAHAVVVKFPAHSEKPEEIRCISGVQSMETTTGIYVCENITWNGCQSGVWTPIHG